MVHAHYVCKRPPLSPKPQRAARGPPGAQRRGPALAVKAAARAAPLLTPLEASPGLQRGREVREGRVADRGPVRRRQLAEPWTGSVERGAGAGGGVGGGEWGAGGRGAGGGGGEPGAGGLWPQGNQQAALGCSRGSEGPGGSHPG